MDTSWNSPAGLMAIGQAFSQLRDNGGAQQTALPMIIQARKDEADKQKLASSLQAARQGGALPNMNDAQFAALAEANPKGLLDLMARPQAPADPWAGTKIVDGNVLKMGPGGPQSIYSAPAKPGYRDATPAELAKYGAKAGQVNEATGKFTPINPATGMRMESDGAGNVTFTQGPGVGGENAPTAIATEAFKGRNAFDSIMKGLDSYEQLTANGGAIIPGEKKDQLDVARRSLQLQMKELFNLGVLNGPDLALMDQLLVDMTSLENNALDAVGIADLGKRTKTNVAQLRQMMVDLIEPKLKSAGLSGGGMPAQPQGLQRTIGGVTYEKRSDGEWYVKR